MKTIVRALRWSVPVIACVALFAAASADAYTTADYNAAVAAYWAKNDECNQIAYWENQALYDPVYGDYNEYAAEWDQCQVELADLYTQELYIRDYIALYGQS